MASIKTIPSNATTETTEDHFLYMLVRLRRNPHTKALVAEAEAFRPKINAARTEERSLSEADMEAGAGVQFADQDLNVSVDFVGDNTDRKSLFGMRLFGDLRPSELKRPVLGGQLDVMSGWPEVLATSEKEILVSHAPVVKARVEAGHAAAAEKKGTSNQLSNFRTVGVRVKLNEEHNALRKSLFGKLGDIQHAKGLPSSWAESFFMQDSSEGLSVTELDRRIGSLEGELDALKKQRDALKSEEAKLAAAKAAASRKEKKARLDAITKARADLEAKESALRAELGEDADPKDE